MAKKQEAKRSSLSNRRLMIRSVVGGIIGCLPLRKLSSQEGFSQNGAEQLSEQNLVSLEDQLNAGLRVVTPGQRAFVTLVANYVKVGKIPRAMVTLVYTWSLKRNPRVPFPYFQFALRALAKRRGIVIP